ncbi:polyadenylate-binding protein-interacting protein 11 [Carica papaya]|uniref:polyadenylate-binding protein-interacting protein 11 n=1 Tax=Carica papaya TaxID=3649 RepID=UPI000B8CA8FB|nr:polyadenylate-binding protein-interacting protein 11 [Carica papaya]XP_021900351.1 polyadenylate-binding protein-interacting protein 11 [Carica papaya]
MAVVENTGADLGASVGASSVSSSTSQDSSVSSLDQDQPKQTHVRSRIDTGLHQNSNLPVLRHDQVLYGKIGAQVGHVARSDGGDGDESFKRDMRELQELFSKLNPMAEEFVPPSLAKHGGNGVNGINGGFYSNSSLLSDNFSAAARNGQVNENSGGRRKKIFGLGKRRLNSRTSMAQREEIIRRTVYVSDIDQQVTEEQLAGLFVSCGQVVDCRICGDPNSVLRFAFIEFTDEESARAALNLSGTMLGFYPVRVLPSKTAIAPVNPTFLPRNEDEREMCARTIYCTNIDKKVSQADVKLFFESVCGEVYRLRLLGDYHHSTRIAFVEFVMAESAIAALNCSGVVLGSLPIRVSPSKTPVRPRAPRLPMH